MSSAVVDEYEIRKLPLEERYEKCAEILRNEHDESKRWDAVWLVGEVAELAGPSKPIFHKVADLMDWVLKNDNNGVVKHEACFQIAARNMRKKIQSLVDAALYDKSGLVKHEALESLGLMRAHESQDEIMKALNDTNPDVSETATFVLKRLERFKGTTYKPYHIL